MTHTERVHVFFGLTATAIALLALWSAYRSRSPARLLWPCATFLLGLFLFLPVEAHTLTYRQDLGWWATFRSALPSHPESWVTDWLRYALRWHVMQHKMGGFLVMVAGAVEFARASGPGRLTWTGWRWLLPLLLVGIGFSFGAHGGSAAHLPHRSEQIQHRLMGIGFVTAAVLLGLTRAGWLRARGGQGLWAAILVLVGVQITFFYRLTPAEREAIPPHQHAGSEAQ